jgi:hypothetical protein
VGGSCEHSNASSDCINFGEKFDKLTDHHLLKIGYALWRQLQFIIHEPHALNNYNILQGPKIISTHLLFNFQLSGF